MGNFKLVFKLKNIEYKYINNNIVKIYLDKNISNDKEYLFLYKNLIDFYKEVILYENIAGKFKTILVKDNKFIYLNREEIIEYNKDLIRNVDNTLYITGGIPRTILNHILTNEEIFTADMDLYMNEYEYNNYSYIILNSIFNIRFRHIELSFPYESIEEKFNKSDFNINKNILGIENGRLYILADIESMDGLIDKKIYYNKEIDDIGLIVRYIRFCQEYKIENKYSNDNILKELKYFKEIGYFKYNKDYILDEYLYNNPIFDRYDMGYPEYDIEGNMKKHIREIEKKYYRY